MSNIANTQQRGLPNSYRWKDETTQLDCLIVWREGYFCGYVGVVEDHPYFEKSHDDLVDVDIHGGLTYSGHVVAKERTTWWFGFDCAHAFDATLNQVMNGHALAENLRGPYYVKTEIESLALQLFNAKHQIPTQQEQPRLT